MHGQKTETGQRRIVFAQAGYHVGGELLAHETVERFVVIEGGDDVVAVGVGVGILLGLAENGALGIGVAGHVQPVAAPAFAVAGVVEKAVDEAVEIRRREPGLGFLR